MPLWKIAWRSIQQRGLASILTVLSMALGVTMVVSVLTIHGVVTESFANNSTLGYNVIVGPKGGKLQLTLNTVYYLSQPIENLPYDYYLEFLPAEEREAAYADSFRQASHEAQGAALALAQAHGGGLGLDGLVSLGQQVGDATLTDVTARALDAKRAGQYSDFTSFAIPLCLGDYYGKFRVVGTVPEFFEYLKELDPPRNRRLEFAQGRPFEHFNDEHGWYEAVLGSTVARQMNVKLGDVVNPSHGDPEGHTHGQGFTVVGILKPTGTPHDRACFVNMEGFYLMDGHANPLVEGVLDEEETSDALAGDESPAASTRAAKRKWPEPLALEQREVTALLVRTVHPIVTQNLATSINKGRTAQAVMPIREIYELLDVIVNPIQYLLLALTWMICFVSGVSILVGIYNSMSDRRRDIAVMRALGAGRLKVSTIILAEAVILSLGGGLLGVVAGHTLNALVSQRVEDQTGVTIGFLTFAPGPRLSELLQYGGSLPWDPSISLELVIIPGMVVLAALAGFVPALVAYRTDVSRSLAP
jgi:putative ABC transport system permease protein